MKINPSLFFSLQNDVRDLQSLLVTKSEINTLITNGISTANSFSQLQSDVTQLQNDVGSNTSDILTNTTNINTNTTNIDALIVNVGNFSLAVNNHSTQILGLQGDVGSLQSSVTTLSNQIQNIDFLRLSDGDFSNPSIQIGDDVNNEVKFFRSDLEGLVCNIGGGKRFNVGINYFVFTAQPIPNNNGGTDLGDSSHRFQDIWATNGTIQTSDGNEKLEVSDNCLGLEFIKNLRPTRYKFKNGRSGRFHYGLISQEVKTCLDKLNIPSSDFAGYVYGRSKPSVEVSNVEKNEVEKEYFGLRYTEFIAPLIKCCQQLDEENTKLKEKVKIHEDSIQDVYKRLIDLETENKRLRK